MSIKIDLLPGYINLQRWFKNWLVIALLALLLTATTLYLLLYQSQQTLAVTQRNLQNIEANAKLAEDTAAAKTTAENASAAVETNVQFLVNAGKTGAERAALVDLTRRYIYSGAVVSSIDMSDGQNVNISATVRDPEEYLRFVYKLREGSATNNGPLFAANPRTQSVDPSGIPGGPNAPFIDPSPKPGEAARTYQYPLSVTAKGVLRYPISVPSETAAGGAPAGGSPGSGPPGSGSPGSGPPGNGSPGSSPPGSGSSSSSSPSGSSPSPTPGR